MIDYLQSWFLSGSLHTYIKFWHRSDYRKEEALGVQVKGESHKNNWNSRLACHEVTSYILIHDWFILSKKSVTVPLVSSFTLGVKATFLQISFFMVSFPVTCITILFQTLWLMATFSTLVSLEMSYTYNIKCNQPWPQCLTSLVCLLSSSHHTCISTFQGLRGPWSQPTLLPTFLSPPNYYPILLHF